MNGCSTTTPPNDERCNDPAFREANPDLCKYHPVLIITPDYSLIQTGQTVTYKVFLRVNGVEEEITLGLTWASSNLAAVEINQDGIASGVTAGQSSISVTWQDLSATAQVDVVANCAETHLNFRLLIDNSRSMGQTFSGLYGAKLAFSKTTARTFCDTINYSKDQVAVSRFNDTYANLQSWTTDADLAKAAIASIPSSTAKTDLVEALTGAIADFEGETGVRVIVLWTDGEWCAESARASLLGTDADPRPIAKAFRESGGILCIVATCAWGDFFADLFEMASAGFLLSAYEEVQTDIDATLAGLKNFLCSGGCTPEPGTAPTAQLNYDGFLNWDVIGTWRDADGNDLGATTGYVDLVGLGVWDVLGEDHNQGLYVDLQGTANYGAAGDPIPHGGLQSKDDFTFTAGEQYKFTIGVGGNYRGVTGLFRIRVRCGDELDENIDVSIPYQDITPYEFTWTPGATHTGKIIIEQIIKKGIQNIGTLIDDIKLENLTLVDTLLDDNFDTENPQTIPPGAGYGYGGCIVLEAQSADPSPPVPRMVE